MPLARMSQANPLTEAEEPIVLGVGVLQHLESKVAGTVRGRDFFNAERLKPRNDSRDCIPVVGEKVVATGGILAGAIATAIEKSFGTK